jgi:hypothetical protein
MPAMHLRRAQPCTSAAHSRAAAASAAALPHARTLSLTQRLPSRTHPASCWPRLTPLARRLLHIMYCLGVHYCTTLWQTFAHNRSDAYSFCSSLQHDARPHDQGCRHPPLAPDEGDSHLQHRRDPTRQALPQEEAGADQDQPHPSAQVARRLLRAGLRRRHRSTYPVRGRRGPSSRARGPEDVMRHEVRGRGRAPRTR